MKVFVSDHRFSITVGLCIVALSLMIGGLYATIGFNLAWDASAHPVAVSSGSEPRAGAGAYMAPGAAWRVRFA